MYALSFNNNTSFANQINWPNLSERFSKGPVSRGTNEDDYFRLDSKTTGGFFGGEGDDRFEYNNDPGKLNTTIRGGRGDDTLALSGLTTEAGLSALKNNGYTFVQFPNGFGLKTREGKLIEITEVEKLAFSDKTFNLLNKEDVQAFVDALSAKGIPIEQGDNTNNNYANESNQPRYFVLVPANNFGGQQNNYNYSGNYSYPYSSSYSNPWLNATNSIVGSFGDNNSYSNSFNNIELSQPQYYGGPSSFNSSLAFNGTGSLNSSLSFSSGGLSSLY